ncbi:MAG: restriction endonuclease subunit S [Candidatus Wallbacteria bacterium]|nr:restriction endonuclease subunit S [Candidatus Wallbacteria bacterium]
MVFKWSTVSIESIAAINPDLPFENLTDDIEVSFLPMKHLEELSGKISRLEIRKYSEVKKGYVKFIDGDILFAKITPCMENGKLAIALHLKNGIGFGSTEFHVIRMPEIVCRKFYFYYFIQEKFRNLAKKSMKGTAGQLRVPADFLKTCQLPLPPLPEQHRIVAKIEELFTRLDAGVEELKKIRKQLKRYRQSVLKAAFEGKLTEKWREEHKKDLESPEILLDRIKKNDKNKNCSVWRNSSHEIAGLLSIPKNWLCVKAEFISEFITKGTTPSKNQMSQGVGEVPFIKVYNLTFDGSLDFSVNPTFVTKETHTGFLARSIVIPGDILINIVGPPLGKVSLVPDDFQEWNINQAIARFRVNDNLDKKFLMFYFQSETTIKSMMKKSKATAGQFNLTLEICRDIDIPVCGLKEQHQIVQEIERRFSVIEKLEKTVEESLRQAERLRQSILKKAFEGRLVPQDPDDEPAEKLLERIRKEKEKLETEKKKRKNRSV